MNGEHRTRVAGVHGLQRFQGFGAPHLADDDAVWAHPQGVLQQVAHVDFAAAFRGRGAGLQAHHVRLPQTQFGGVFQRDHALFHADVFRQRVQEGGLAGAGAARDDDIQLRLGGEFQHGGHARMHRFATCQIGDGEAALAEPADGDGGAVDSQRRANDVHPRTVFEAGVAHGVEFVHVAPDVFGDALGDAR